MAKSTKAQAVSTGTADSYTEHELSDETPPVRITRAMLGRVDQCPPTEMDGTSSLESSEKTNPSSGQSLPPDQAPAQNAENRSDPPEGSSTVLSTDGNGEELPPDDDILPYEEWTYSDLQAECKERDLPAGGKKEELVSRLIEDDETAEVEE